MLRFWKILVSIFLACLSIVVFSSAAFAQTVSNQTVVSPSVASTSIKIVGIAEVPNGSGYWLAASNGAVIAYGSAQYYGSMAGKYLAAPIIGITATNDGNGYWLVAKDGGVFSFGDAHFYGSAANLKHDAPIVSMTPTLDNRGYWLLSADGDVFNFGDAIFNGNVPDLGHGITAAGIATTYNKYAMTGYNIDYSNGADASRYYEHGGGPGDGIKLNKPIIGIVAYPSFLHPYDFWMVASDGGVFTNGNHVPFCGSLGGTVLSSPVVGMATNLWGNGYMLVQANGRVTSFSCLQTSI